MQVVLSVDGTEVGSETVDLSPGQSRIVSFKYRPEVSVEPGKAVFLPAKVSIPPDHLPGDDFRVLCLPVVAALPVVFVDQYGSDEDPRRNRYGETRLLRRWFAPHVDRGARSSIDRSAACQNRPARPRSAERRPHGRDRRCRQPGGEVSELRDYVRQGGATGDRGRASSIRPNGTMRPGSIGEVSSVALKPQPIGKMPVEASGELRPFALSFPSMVGDEFRLADVPESELEDLYSLPLFFKAVEADASDETLAAEMKTEEKRIAEERQFLTDADSRLRKWSEASTRPADRSRSAGTRRAGERRQQAAPIGCFGPSLRPIRPWPKPRRPPSPNAAARRVVAAFDNQVPFLVDRGMGRGHVLFMASGLLSDWNTLPKTHAMCWSTGCSAACWPAPCQPAR